MTLNDIEAAAQRVLRTADAELNHYGGIFVSHDARASARAWLAALPVLRLAERIRAASAACSPRADAAEFDRAYQVWVTRVAEIDHAIDAMHEELRKP